MPIAATDIHFYKSIQTDSDGGAIDLSREITDGVDNNVWPDITGAEQISGGTRYRKIYVRNQHATLSWLDVRDWISAQPSNATLSVGVGVNHTDDNIGAQGNMTAFSASALAAVISDGADTRVVTVIGETAAGVYQTENITLNGAVEVVGALTFGKVYAAYAASESATRTVTLRQGAGGTARGSIPPNEKITFLWRTGTDLDSESDGFRHGTIAVSGNAVIWLRKVWPANAVAGMGFSPQIICSGGSS